MVLNIALARAHWYYDALVKVFTGAPILAGSAMLLVDAPFGRFSPKNSRWTVDGRWSWFIMEIVSPITFACSIVMSPVNSTATNLGNLPFSLKSPQALLSCLFLIHYANRAVISPLRSPSRSRSHIIIPIAAIAYNLVNGFLMGSYLSSPAAAAYLKDAFHTPRFWFGVLGWAAGFVGNIVHDEILMNLRRDKNVPSTNAPPTKDSTAARTEKHYSIPYGYLYKYISYPNYFSEWFEWGCFALAAAPFPMSSSATLPHWSNSPLALRFAKAASDAGSIAPATGITLLHLGARTLGLTPPWTFLFSEFLVMLPRALSGHRWYHQKLPDYPKDRAAAIPFIL